MKSHRTKIIVASVFLAVLLVGAGSLIATYYRWRATLGAKSGDSRYIQPIGKFNLATVHFGACFAFQDAEGGVGGYSDSGTVFPPLETITWASRGAYCMTVSLRCDSFDYTVLVPMPQ